MKKLFTLVAFAPLLLSFSKETTEKPISEEMLFINKFIELAKEEQFRTEVPACITLAQAMIESRLGKSFLADSANNYFGIKCGSAWDGPFVYHNDDKPHEKFRMYASAAESFKDHSNFLKKQHYVFLFKFDPANYKAWAKGLQKAGYATNPHYASLLIHIIETYHLVELNLNDEDIENMFLISYSQPQQRLGFFMLKWQYE